MHSRAIPVVFIAAAVAASLGPPSATAAEPDGPRRIWRPEHRGGALPPAVVIGSGARAREVLELDAATCGETSLIFEGFEARPAAATFEFRIAEVGEGAHGFGVILSARSSVDYLFVHLDRYRQVIVGTSDAEDSWREIARRGGLSYGCGEWHLARVESGAGKLRVLIDGVEALARDGVNAGPGRFGFYASDGRVELREVSFEGTPEALDPPWRERPRHHHVTVCADAGAGGYQAFPDVVLRRSTPKGDQGEMLCVFYAGFGHVSLPALAPGGKPPPECPRGGRICLVRSADLGRTWSKAETVVDTPLDDRDPSITELPGGDLLVVFFQLEPGPGGEGYRFARSSAARSSDGGHTWTEPAPLFAEWAVSSPVRVLSDGRLALSLYYVGAAKSPGGSYGGVSFSADDGKTWSEPIPVGKEGPLALDAEPDLVELPGGRLLMALRPVLALASSDDGGRTWSEPRRAGFGGDCPYFLRLRSGLLLLAHRIPGTSLHTSADGGATWGPACMIDPVGGAYPSLCELPPSFPEGTVFAVYYEEGPRSAIRGRWLRATREGVQAVWPWGEEPRAGDR